MTAPTCDGVCDTRGRCDPKHPTHCCHFMVTYPAGRFGAFACMKCGKKSLYGFFEGRGMDELKRDLANIDTKRLKRSEVVISLKALAFELGIGRSTFHRWCLENGVELPHWGPSKRSPVFLPRQKIAILKAIYFA